MDSGSSRSTGSATTIGLVGLTPMVAGSKSKSESVTGLGASFAPPAQVSENWIPLMILPLLLGLLVYLVATTNLSVPGGLALALAFVLAAAAGSATYWFSVRPRVERNERWREGLQRLRAGYFCSRDGRAFSEGSLEALPPSAFVASCFAGFEKGR